MHRAQAVAQASGGTWKFYIDDHGINVVKNEIDQVGESIEQVAMVRDEVLKLLRAAVSGDLVLGKDIKDISSNPLLYELRWTIGDAHIPDHMWRLYFGWHSNEGPLRLALKFGEKPAGDAGPPAQELHIAEAGARYRVWYQRRYP